MACWFQLFTTRLDMSSNLNTFCFWMFITVYNYKNVLGSKASRSAHYTRPRPRPPYTHTPPAGWFSRFSWCPMHYKLVTPVVVLTLQTTTIVSPIVSCEMFPWSVFRPIRLQFLQPDDLAPLTFIPMLLRSLQSSPAFYTCTFKHLLYHKRKLVIRYMTV